MSVTYLNLVLDRSGSMTSTWSDAVGGLKQLLKEQREQPGTLVVDLTVFDDVVEHPVTQAVLSEGDTTVEDAIDNVKPRGVTALLDAVGKAYRQAEATLNKASLSPDNVLFVVVTDGMENASQEYTSEAIKGLIEGAEDWDFVYIGANQDAWFVGGGLGFSASMDYDATKEGTRMMYNSLSASLTSYRSTGEVDLTPDAQ